MARMWMVRCEGASQYGAFRERGLAAVGWNQLASYAKPGVGRKLFIPLPVRRAPGKDIVASPDGFGFEHPRIVVEVKYRKERWTAKKYMAFLAAATRMIEGCTSVLAVSLRRLNTKPTALKYRWRCGHWTMWSAH